ncbi:hypothetical protein shn_13915 [Shinella sp. HZN7]|nr:hypothetical protein shn_13915 [Shinella sp. HZN7]
MDVEDLQSAYRASLAGLKHSEAEIEARVRDELGLGPDDEWPHGDDADPEDPVGSVYERAGELDAQAKRGAPMVRTAFLIALFHAWERHCNTTMKTMTYVTTDVNSVLQRDGHGSSCDDVEYLQLAANCAKHGPGKSCRALFRKRPDLFPTATSETNASHSTLSIEDATLTDFFETILSITRP